MTYYGDQYNAKLTACGTEVEIRQATVLENITRQIKDHETRLVELNKLKELLEKNPEFEMMISLLKKF